MRFLPSAALRCKEACKLAEPCQNQPRHGLRAGLCAQLRRPEST